MWPLLRLAAPSLASVRTRTVGAALVVVALAGCGSKKLDAQQQSFEVKACMSLIERHVANDNAPITIDGHKLMLANTKDFYDTLARLRPPTVFKLDDPTSLQYGPHSELSDLCKDKASAPSSSATASTSTGSSATTTTATTTTTTLTTTTP